MLHGKSSRHLLVCSHSRLLLPCLRIRSMSASTTQRRGVTIQVSTLFLRCLASICRTLNILCVCSFLISPSTSLILHGILRGLLRQISAVSLRQLQQQSHSCFFQFLSHSIFCVMVNRQSAISSR